MPTKSLVVYAMYFQIVQNHSQLETLTGCFSHTVYVFGYINVHVHSNLQGLVLQS